jgi:hypothetical protein
VEDDLARRPLARRDRPPGGETGCARQLRGEPLHALGDPRLIGVHASTCSRRRSRSSQSWLNRWFDVRQKPVATAAQTLAQLAATAVNVELPTIADSLNAVRTLKMPREKTVR